jgi:hypothetical protein
VGDQVGRVVDLTAKAPDDVAVGLAESMGDPLVWIRAEQVGQRGRWLDPRRRQLDRLQGDRLLDLLAAEPELLPDPRRGGRELGPRGLAILEPPAPVLAPAGCRPYQ